jgi:hypothetical protein
MKAIGDGGIGSRGIIEGAVVATAVYEAVLAGCVVIIADDLTRVVDPGGDGAIGREGIIKRGVATRAVKKAV